MKQGFSRALLPVACVLAIVATGTATATSLYLVPNHHTDDFDAWNINPDGTVVYQGTYDLQYATDPAGIAIDSVPFGSELLFITSEFSTGVEILDPSTLTYIGVSSGPSNLAGIDVDDVNDIVYTIRRNSCDLYVYDWNPDFVPPDPPPDPICDDPSRSVFAGGPYDAACHQFDGDQVACEAAYALTAFGFTASCFYDAGSCMGCGTNNLWYGNCTNECSTCDDPARSIFAGGPADAGCGQFNGDQSSCEAAWAVSSASYRPTACFYDAGICRGCEPADEVMGGCANTCWEPPLCDDTSRTIFAGGPFTSACRQFDGDQASCEAAYAMTGYGTLASCFYASGECVGCGPGNTGSGACTNTCDPTQSQPGPLVLRDGYPITLPNCAGGFGLALDETRDTLWIADTASGAVRAYDIDTWTEDVTRRFFPSHHAVDVAVDRERNFIYTVSIIGGASIPPGTGSTLLSKYDPVAGVEVTVDMGHPGVGVAVDEASGYVYVTGGADAGDNLTVWDTSTTPFTRLQDTGVIGNPAGIAIGSVSFNPLNLVKNDEIAGQGVYIGSEFTYEITFDSPSIDLANVTLTDDLPAELHFVSATEGGVYDMVAHTVVWDLGTILAGDPIPVIDLQVRVNQTAEPGSTIYNYCTLESDELPPVTVIPNPGDPDPGTGVLPAIPVALDIKPTSCPNPLRLKSKGTLPVAILGSMDLDVQQIDPAALLLEGVAPLRWSYEDVATPFEPIVGKEDCLADCTTAAEDGHLDLTMKFDTREVIAALGEVQDRECLVLRLTGNFTEEYGETQIVGEDVIIILSARSE